jgi:hypothetical protein
MRKTMIERASSERIQFAGTSAADLNAAMMAMRGADFRARRAVQGMQDFVQLPMRSRGVH